MGLRARGGDGALAKCRSLRSLFGPRSRGARAQHVGRELGREVLATSGVVRPRLVCAWRPRVRIIAVNQLLGLHKLHRGVVCAAVVFADRYVSEPHVFANFWSADATGKTCISTHSCISHALPTAMPLAVLSQVVLPSVADEHRAHGLYVTGLGGRICLADDGNGLTLNIGASQLRFEPCRVAPSYGPGWEPVLEFWTTEALEALHHRIGTECPSFIDEATCLRCHDSCASAGLVVRPAPPGLMEDPEGSHPGGSGSLISLTRVAYAVPLQAASMLHDLFASVFALSGSDVLLGEDSCSRECCTIRFASGQELVFAEVTEGRPSDCSPSCHDATSHRAPALALGCYVDSLDGFREAYEAACRFGDCRVAAHPSAGTGWAEAHTRGLFRLIPRDTNLQIEVRSLAHPACPLPRRDLVAAGVPVATAPALANWPPLPPLPFAERGIPRCTGTFGESARELAQSRRVERAGEQEMQRDGGPTSAEEHEVGYTKVDGVQPDARPATAARPSRAARRATSSSESYDGARERGQQQHGEEPATKTPRIPALSGR